MDPASLRLPPSLEPHLHSLPPPQSALKSKERKAVYAAQLQGKLATLNAEVQVLTDRAAELSSQGTSLTREVQEFAGQVSLCVWGLDGERGYLEQAVGTGRREEWGKGGSEGQGARRSLTGEKGRASDLV